MEAKKVIINSLRSMNPARPNEPIKQVSPIIPRKAGKLEKKAFAPRFTPFRVPEAYMANEIQIRKGSRKNMRSAKNGMKL